ncbi:beta-ketoacyl synthase domain-containing protein [Rostrohypoxylon terebratum]|nr:beta-ketoacyl synthase domain-containing protein [Rostrohypoxylon terebratum]
MVYKRPSSEPVAIVGSSCRFAGDATSLAKLWQVLCEAPDLSKEVPPERFNVTAFYHPDGEYHGTTNSTKAYWLQQDHRVFDASMFNITPKEAEAMDPQQRMILEVVYEAMESAGYTLDKYYGKNVAVFSGVMTGDHDTLCQRDELSTSQYYATGNARSIISNRISYFFNFRGPSMTIDTACSSSLVALHQAMLSLRSGESTMACVTGVNLMLTPEQFLVESSLHMLSPTGKSRMWDESADGYARGEGVAALLLKPLSRALADGDQIMALVRDTGINSDGRTKGITLPNPEAQSSLIKDTYRRTGLDSTTPEDQCQYFEAHGTGTPAGDPREAEAISKAFFDPCADNISASDTCNILVGSCKTVLGHTEGAAGLAGLLKVIQAMKHGTIPPNLHFSSINPNVKPFYTHLEIPTSLTPWPQPPTGQPKRASINSFGFGGANAHAIIESYEPHIHDAIYRQNEMEGKEDESLRREYVTDTPSTYLPLLLSAASHVSLRAVISSYREHLSQHPDIEYGRLAWDVFSRRTALPYRLVVSASSRSELLRTLEEILSKSPSSGTIGIRSQVVNKRPKIIGVFTGQGAQWTTMSKSLFHNNQTYRNTIRELNQILKSCSHPPEWSLEEQIMAEGHASRVNVAAVSQPLCTAVQIGLVNILNSLDIRFHTVVGHSSGEIAAAYAAGRISERDAILVSYYRGYWAHLAKSPEGEKGGMLAVGISEKEAFKFCDMPMFNGRLHVAASNAPSSVTLSGDLDMIRKAHEELTRERKFSRVLVVDSAYHSPHMVEPAAEYVKTLQADDIKFDGQGNGTAWLSSVHGRPMDEAEKPDAEYWKDNMVNMVRFRDAIVNAVSQHGPFDCALEIGPHPALKGPFTQTAKSLGHDFHYSCPLDRTKDDSLAFSDFLGVFWSLFGPQETSLGKYIEQSPSAAILSARVADLPTYPWDHSQIHYRESRISRQFHFKSDSPHELLGVRTRDDNEHEMRWRNLLKLDKLPWVEHHSFQGQALLPASAYCVMALDAARYLLGKRSASLIELQDIHIISGINIDRDSVGTEVLFSLSTLPRSGGSDGDSVIEASFALVSCPADGTTVMRKNMTGHLKIYLGEPTSDALPTRCPSESETFLADPESFYKMMEETGLTYTGPFHALTSIRRRYNFCSAALRRWHPEDSTTLQISAATLDSCFQSAFLTYAFPGDESLWTSFLPIYIDRIRFNLSENKGDNLIVDTHMVDIKPTTTDSKATFLVDLGIFNEGGDMEIQVEGLTVAALAHTIPKNDRELYLNTVFDIDPTDEIVRDTSSNTVDPALIEDCVRIATFYVRENLVTSNLPLDLSSYYEKLASLFPGVLGTVGVDSWRLDTKETIDNLVQSSSCRDRLNLIRELDIYQPDFVVDALRVFIEETHHLSCTSRHVGRIAKQVAHRYPRMDILSLAGPESDLVADVLRGVGSAFVSFTISTGPLRYPNNKETPVWEEIGKKIVQLPLDLTKALRDQLGHGNSYDLVLLSASELEDNYVPNALKYLREIMRPGGFLIVVQSSRSLTKSRLLRSSKGQYDEAGTPTPPQWPDVLDTHGFVKVARDCDQSYFAGYSVMVRQLSSPEIVLLNQPSEVKGDPMTDHLLVIGGDSAPSHRLIRQLEKCLMNMCKKVTVRATFDEVDSELLNDCTAAIVLADIDQPLMTNMTERTLDQLRDLLRPGMKILWLTVQALSGNPDNAATFGFTRTVSAEVPGLMLQVLDLEDIEGSEELVATQLICLMGRKEDESDTLWTNEYEIHIRDGRRLIPRVLPLQQSNDRFNAFRRVVSVPVNTLQQPVEINPCLNSDRLVRYEATSMRSDAWAVPTDQDQVQIQVDYSPVEALRVNIEESGKMDDMRMAYICFGVNSSTGEGVVAISRTNASYLSLPSEQVYPITSNADISLPLTALVVRYMVAESISNRAAGQPIVLIDADPVLAQCIVESVEDRRSIISYSTRPPQQDSGHTSKFLHARASVRDVKAIFPPKGAVVFDFQLAKHAKPSEQISNLLPANCGYYSRSTLFNTVEMMDVQDFRGNTNWKRVVSKALKADFSATRRHVESDITSLPDLLSDTDPSSSSPFRLIDWRADRNAVCLERHHMANSIFRPDRTYVLIGTTKDLGQSLCSLLTEHGARNIVLASRNPKMDPRWVEELSHSYDAKIEIHRCDVTDLASVEAFRKGLSKSMPPIAGIVNGAMVLDDRVFAQMDLATWERVLQPKTIGSLNLDIAFGDVDLDFFIMTSSFAAIGGHPGQANYAAANMYMNGLAGLRRSRGQAASVLNIGVIYGLGFLLREKEELYAGLEREGYPPISERDIHHMFLEAVATGRPGGVSSSEPPISITTGLRRFDPTSQNPLHWHQDPRFSHYTSQDNEESGAMAEGTRKQLKDSIAALAEPSAIAQAIFEEFTERLHTLLHIPKESIHAAQTMSELGIDSLAAVEVRAWIFKTVGKDVSVIQLLGGSSIQKLCAELASKIMADRKTVEDDSSQ